MLERVSATCRFAALASSSHCRAPSSCPLPRQGFITAEEVLSIPELSINPLAKRLAYMYDSINFKEFLVRACAAGFG